MTNGVKPKSGKSGKFASAQDGAKARDTGKKKGSPAQSCPKAKLKVVVKPVDPKLRPSGKLKISVTGQKDVWRKVEQTAEYTGLAAGDYEASADLKDWILKERKTAHLEAGGEATIELRIDKYELVKIEPTTPPKPTPWYVNLPSDETKKQGRTVTVKAYLNREIAGVTVYFTLDANSSNRASLQNALKPALSAASVATDDKGVATITLTLSRYGGDKVRVSASLKQNTKPGKAGSLQTQWFETWREVYYELETMKRPGSTNTYSNLADTGKFAAEYQKAFVKMVSVGSDDKPAHKRVITESEVDTWATPFRSSTGAPRYVHLALIDSIIWDPAEQEREYEISSMQTTLTLPAATNTMDGRDWLVAGSVEISKKEAVGANPAAWGAWAALANPQNHLRLSWADDNFKIAVDFRNAGGLGAGPNLPAGVSGIKLKLKLKIWEEGSGLKTGGGTTIVGIRWRERKYSGNTLKNRTVNTMIHEVGHAVGLASTTLPDGTNLRTAGITYYQSGWHCHRNSNTCVMWEANLAKYQFCDKCRDALRGRNLATLSVSGNAAM